MLQVEVVYARADVQALTTVELMPGATIEQAIMASGLLRQFPEIDIGRIVVGVHGMTAKLSDNVAHGDRVEIYRPLVVDAKELRRRRAKARRRL